MSLPMSKIKEIARKEEKYIIKISIFAKHLPAETVKRLNGKIAGSVDVVGPATVAEADELWDLFMKWQNAHAAAKKGEKE